ncbi:site-specific integrase [Paraliomyxa miuraensis]|uniref:site-specific integrase n=1 Tax=Paraliomyxa miuraensis TaxID=376150 RepID=UPI00225C02D9|nr:site-specific integrase [Paraliomyxa miuraensis]MCX4243672.1 site-specific integrase [Paraliomyxa miuraensis]
MPTLRLTNASIRSHTHGKRVELWDTVVPGLLVIITANGAQTFYLKYRSEGQQQRVKLGAYGTALTIEQARKQAQVVRGSVARGENPQAERKQARQAMRVVDLLGEKDDEGWYLGSYCKVAGQLGTAKSEGALKTDRYRINKHLRSRGAFMRMRVDAVTTADLEQIQQELTAGTWRKLRDVLRICFRHAEDLGVIARSPAARLKATSDRKVERYLSPEERQRLEAALAYALEAGPQTKGGLAPGYVRVFRLLSLTGMRLGEVVNLRWEYVDWRHGQLRLPTSKTGAKSVPLTRQALEFLRKERGRVGRIGLVCPNESGERLSNVQRAWRTLRAHAGLDDVRIHDLRHSWASDAISADVSLPVVGKVLGHKSSQTTARYAHLHDRALQDGLERAGAAIEHATNGGG